MKSAKRFYKTVTVAERGHAFEVHLDGYQLKTPGKILMSLSSRAHAEIVASEWDGQKDDIRPETMPCTRLVNVALERTPQARDTVVSEARNYAQTDLLCYRAIEPESLVERQTALWDPILEWARGVGMNLHTTDSLIAIDQTPEALDRVTEYVSGLDDLMLTLCVHLIAVYGSAILGIAVIERHLSAGYAFTLSQLDELWQIEKWGEDEEAAQRRQSLADEVVALSGFLS